MSGDVSLIEILYASGILGVLVRMSYDVHDIKKVFRTMKERLEAFQTTLDAHEKRISKLEQEGKTEE